MKFKEWFTEVTNILIWQSGSLTVIDAESDIGLWQAYHATDITPECAVDMFNRNEPPTTIGVCHSSINRI